MKAPDIPLRYRTNDAAALAQDLGRLAVGLVTFFRTLPSARDTVPEIGKLATDGAILGFGTMARVSPRDGQWITLKLPAPSPANGGRALQIWRLSSLGAVEIVATDCTVSGYERILLLGTVGVTTFYLDGTNYSMDPIGALNWGYGLHAG
ncbi:MAG TPA: hypothetical protein VGK73_28005 [Polyangiaceae bacterium]